MEINLYEILQIWISNPEYITAEDINSDYIARYEQRKAFKKIPAHIRIPLKCLFDFAYYHKSSNIQHLPLIKLRVLTTTLKFLQNQETKEDINKIFTKINEEILNYIKQSQTIERYLGWWIIVFLYDKFPSYKHSDELDKLLWNNLEGSLRNQIITPKKDYLVEWLKNIAMNDKNNPKDLRLKKIFLKLAFNWIIFQRKNGTDKNNDEILEILSAVNNIPLNFESHSDKRQFDDLKQKFAQLNFEYSLGEQKKLFYYRFMKKSIKSIDDIFFDSLIHLRFDGRSGVTYSIWKGKLNSISIKVVIKCFSSSSKESLKKYEKEKYFLKKLSMKHSFFLNFYQSFYDVYINKTEEVAYYIVMEYCKWTIGKEINYRIEHGKTYTPFIAHDIYKLLEGFCELKNRGFIHHDIKPDNIFIDVEGNYKIGDFGLSFKFNDELDDETNTVQGTIDYMAPEIREAYGDRSFKSKKKYFSREKSDVFSLGLVFLKMATLKPISGLNTKWSDIRLKNIVSSVEPLWLSRLLFKMLEFDFKKRASFSEAFLMLTRDGDYLKDKFYIIEINRPLSISSKSSVYFIEKIKEKCRNFDIDDIWIIELLKFLCKLDKCKNEIDLLKEFLLQQICNFLIERFKNMTLLARREYDEKFREIMELINNLNCANLVIIREVRCLIYCYLRGKMPTPDDDFASDIILDYPYENSDYFTKTIQQYSDILTKTIENENETLTSNTPLKNFDYDGDIFNIEQIEMDTCELCISDALPGIKIERWKGHRKEDIIAGLVGLSKELISIKIYTYHSLENQTLSTGSKYNNENTSLETEIKKWKTRIENEAHIMKILSEKGKNFLKYYGAFYQRFKNDTKFYIVTEDWKHSLSSEINHLYNSQSKYADYMISLIVYELIKSVLVMKKNRIFHHGLSTDAIVISSKDSHVKIIDFCFSFQSERTEDSTRPTNELTIHIKSEEYASPEQALTNKEKAKFRREQSDVFSLGLVILSIACSEPIWGLNRDEEALCITMSKIEVPWVARLLSYMLNFNYKKRPGFKEVSDFLVTDEEFIYDLLKSKAIKDWQSKQSMIKSIFNFALQDDDLIDDSLAFSQGSTKDTSAISQSYKTNCSRMDKMWISNIKMPIDNGEYHRRDFFLPAKDGFINYEEIMNQIIKFSFKRNLFLKFYGAYYQQIEAGIENKEANQIQLTILLELCEITLTQFMHINDRRLKYFQIAGMLYDLINSFIYLKRNKIFILDLNSDDFIINRTGELKIYKYINKFQYWSDKRKEIGCWSVSFTSPEIQKILVTSNTEKADQKISREKAAVYSIGLILLYLLDKPIDSQLKIFWPFNKDLKWAKKILMQMLISDNNKRPRLSEIKAQLLRSKQFKNHLDTYKLSQKCPRIFSNKRLTDSTLNSKKASNAFIMFDPNERRLFYQQKLKFNEEQGWN